MNLNQLQYFVTLAHLEHYTKAAEVLSITQPSLSHAISMLEQELRTSLFEKQGRNVVLTKYGRIFLEYVEESLKILEIGIKKTKAMTGTTSGVIEVAYIYTLGSEFVPQLVAGFLKTVQDMDIQFKFTVGNTSEILRGLKEDRYDVAFCSRKEKENNIIFTPVTKEELVVVVPKDHPFSKKDAIDLADIGTEPQIMFTPSSGLRPVIDEMFKKARVKPNISYEVEEDGAVAGLVAQHFGIAVMPDIPVLKTLDVERIPIRKPKYERHIYMATMKTRYKAPVVKLFTDYAIKKNGKKG